MATDEYDIVAERRLFSFDILIHKDNRLRVKYLNVRDKRRVKEEVGYSAGFAKSEQMYLLL